MRDRLIVTLVGVLAVLSVAQPSQAREPYENQWGPFTGTVVDASTGEPIPGAVFTVIWIRWIPFIAHPWEYFYDVRVAVADEAGRFEIPRRFPALLGFLIEPVRLSCIAPEYAPFRDVGAQNAPISVKLRALGAEKRRSVWSDDPALGSIPQAKCREIEALLNRRRQQMPLPPIGFCSGDIEGAP